MPTMEREDVQTEWPLPSEPPVQDAAPEDAIEVPNRPPREQARIPLWGWAAIAFVGFKLLGKRR